MRQNNGSSSSTKFGYGRTSQVVNRAINFTLALILLILAAPLMVLLYVVVVVADGTPGFYAGKRMGRNKRIFRMYKFRTLIRGADKILGAELLTSGHRLTNPVGQFLRETRLDELPQLLNILKGDMDFVGPRPVRPEVYEKVCRYIRNYDRRFRVNPGLLGLAQLLTPHNTPKRIRSLIDNLLVRKKQRLAWDLWFILFTAASVLRISVEEGLKRTRVFLKKLVDRKFEERRRQERVEPDRAYVTFESGEHQEQGELIDINEEAFLMVTDRELEEPLPDSFELTIEAVRGFRSRGIRRAECRGSLYRKIERGDGRYGYVVVYEAVSPLDFYFFHQYFLDRSVA